MKKNSSDVSKQKKPSKGFFSKLWKSKDDKKKTSKSVDNLSELTNNNFKKEFNGINENQNDPKKAKSLDILNDNIEVKESESPNNFKKAKSLDILNCNIEVEDIKLLSTNVQSSYDNNTNDDNTNDDKASSDSFSQDNGSFHTSLEYTEDPLKKSDTMKSDYKDAKTFTIKDALKDIEENSDESTNENDNSYGKSKLEVIEESENKLENEKDNSHRKSGLTLLINNKALKLEKDGLTPAEFAKKLFDLEDPEYEGKPIILILTETDPYHIELLKCFMDNFDFSNVEIDEALRTLCKKVVITGETQQIDRLLAQFSKHYFESNPHRQDLFINEDVTHSIVYSLVLLNTDLHIVYNDNPNKKMTKKEFLKNTMTLLESMTDEPFSSSQKIKSANIPNLNRRSFFASPSSSSPQPFASMTLPRNFTTESPESKQKRWKKQMEQLLGDLYNSIRTKKIIQKAIPKETETTSSQSLDVPSSSNSINSADPSKAQTLFGNDKSNSSTFSSMKSLIGKSGNRKVKDKNNYLSTPILNSDAASYNSASDLSYSNRSCDRLSMVSKSNNGLGNNRGNAIIVQKGALNRKHYTEQGRQRAKDKRWVKAHCALFIDQSGSANGICELRIWIENSSSKKKNSANRDIEDIFEIAAGEPDIESQNIPYYQSNYQEALPINHSVTNIIKTYNSISVIRKNVFSLRLSSGSTYLFEAASEDIMNEWVNVLNYWAARKSKEPLRGAVGNMEYGWSQVEKIEKPKTFTEEEIHEPIPVFDVIDNNFDAESIKSYSSSNHDNISRTNSIRSGYSSNKNDISNKDLILTPIQDSFNNIKEERPTRSFTIGRFGSTSRSTSRNSDLRSTARSISLNREDNGTSGSKSNSNIIRSNSYTHLSSSINSSPSPRPSQGNTNINILGYDNGDQNSTIPSNHSSPVKEQFDPLVNSDNNSTKLNNEKHINETEKNINEDKEKDKKSLNSNDENPESLLNNSSIKGNQDSQEKIKIENKFQNNNNENNNNPKILDPSNINSNSNTNLTLEAIKAEDRNLLHRRILSEPQLKVKKGEDKNSSTKRSQSLNHCLSNTNITKSENNVTTITPINITPINKTPINKTPTNITSNCTTPNNTTHNGTTPNNTTIASPESIRSKLEKESVIEEEQTNTPYVLPSVRQYRSRVASKHQSLMPDKLLNAQKLSIQPGGTLTIKKKIKKLRISDWTQPGVGYLLSVLPLEQQFESMKHQYLITERELEEHKEIKQPMEDLYVFQSTAYQKACNNWNKKYMYLLDEKSKYGLYVNILEKQLKEDPKEEHVFPITERKSSITSYTSSHISSTSSLGPSSTSKKPSLNGELATLPEKKEKASQEEIQSILAKKRQQQLDMMRKTANDLSIDSGKLEKSFALPEINIGTSLFDDDEYEKEMEELALEQERILNMNNRD
ncbi:hypothetical protein H8356DRAFT_1427340 [Neocallimastix lanati (nom. inval.)]|jgi:hypothetical protein|nr:hypothetical protein H8356DRAFT_1427340 [Neocallimastix sp. JGI-2020a]